MFFADLPINSPPSHYEYNIPAKPVTLEQFVPKTQIFVDVNWTVTCMDSYGYESMTDEQIMAVLTVDAARQIEQVWEEGLPSMSYYSYVEEYLYPMDPSHDEAQRRALTKIRDAEYAKLYDRLSEEDCDYWLNKVLAAKEKYKALSGKKVFTSFIKLVEHYQNDKSCQIVLRTFGKDGPVVVKEVNEILGPYFNLKMYKLCYENSDYFRLKLAGAEDEIIHRKDLAARIYQLGNCIVQDDFDSWHREGQSRTCAKAFPIDTNPEYKRIFFDDWGHIKTILSPFNAETGELMEVSETYVPKFSTMDLILDDDAMINLVNGALVH